MKVYKMKLAGDDRVYWLTEKTATPIGRQWQNGDKGVFSIKAYNLMCGYSKIREIRAVEEHEPYPKEFQQQLAEEGTKALPQRNPNIGAIANLPTTRLLLDKNFHVFQLRPWELKKLWQTHQDQVPYFYEATVHYREGSQGKEYYLQLNDIKRLLKMRFDKENPEYDPLLMAEWRYGVPNASLAEKTRSVV